MSELLLLSSSNLKQVAALADALQEHRAHRGFLPTARETAVRLVEAWETAGFPFAGDDAHVLYGHYVTRGALVADDEEDQRLIADLVAHAAVLCADQLVTFTACCERDERSIQRAPRSSSSSGVSPPIGRAPAPH